MALRKRRQSTRHARRIPADSGISWTELVTPSGWSRQVIFSGVTRDTSYFSELPTERGRRNYCVQIGMQFFMEAVATHTNLLQVEGRATWQAQP